MGLEVWLQSVVQLGVQLQSQVQLELWLQLEVQVWLQLELEVWLPGAQVPLYKQTRSWRPAAALQEGLEPLEGELLEQLEPLQQLLGPQQQLLEPLEGQLEPLEVVQRPPLQGRCPPPPPWAARLLRAPSLL